MSNHFQRRLAAIMFTDIEGYTSLMQRSEQAAMRSRERRRQVFEATTTKYRGQIVQYYGDGTLSIFNSAVEAVRCARELQLQFQKEPVIPVRIGVHVGDILVAKEDIVGDEVNIAARLVSIPEPWAVLFSDTVWRDIANKNHHSFVLPFRRYRQCYPIKGLEVHRCPLCQKGHWPTCDR